MVSDSIVKLIKNAAIVYAEPNLPCVPLDVILDILTAHKDSKEVTGITVKRDPRLPVGENYLTDEFGTPLFIIKAVPKNTAHCPVPVQSNPTKAMEWVNNHAIMCLAKIITKGISEQLRPQKDIRASEVDIDPLSLARAAYEALVSGGHIEGHVRNCGCPECNINEKKSEIPLDAARDAAGKKIMDYFNINPGRIIAFGKEQPVGHYTSIEVAHMGWSVFMTLIPFIVPKRESVGEEEAIRVMLSDWEPTRVVEASVMELMADAFESLKQAGYTITKSNIIEDQEGGK